MLFAHLAGQLTRDTGLSESDYVVLVAVSEAPGRRLRARDLGLALDWDRSRLSRHITRMEQRGSVEREPCAGDARGYDVVVTEDGLAAVHRAAEIHVAAGREAFIDLPTVEQLYTLAEIAETVLARLAGEQPPDA